MSCEDTSYKNLLDKVTTDILFFVVFILLLDFTSLADIIFHKFLELHSKWDKSFLLMLPDEIHHCDITVIRIVKVKQCQ